MPSSRSNIVDVDRAIAAKWKENNTTMLSLRLAKRILNKSFLPAITSGFSTSSQECSAIQNVTVIGSGLMGSGIAQVNYTNK